MQIRTVMIVGGGSSGWMTAAALSKLCPHLKISLVESEKIGTIGVGESTIGGIRQWTNFIGLEDSDFLKETDGSYKLSIKFTDFYKKDAETVSGSDAKELGTVKNNFLIKKLGLSDGPKLDAAMEKVVETMGKSNRNKYRAIFYYLLVKEFGKESIY